MQRMSRVDMNRIAVVGTSCSGKTTFARSLAERMGCLHIELDAVHWGPQWTERPDDVVLREVEKLTQAEAWVICGNYSFLRDIIWSRADTIVWLNYSFPVVWSRALRRTLRRSFRREELWAGNRESLKRAFLSRDSILLWVLQTYHRRRREYTARLALPVHAHLRKIVFRHPVEAEQFLERQAWSVRC